MAHFFPNTDPVPLTEQVHIGINRFGIVEHGFEDKGGKWWPVCALCGNHKWEAKVDGDTLCLACEDDGSDCY